MAQVRIMHAPRHLLGTLWMGDTAVAKAIANIRQYQEVAVLDLPQEGMLAADEVFDLTNNPCRGRDRNSGQLAMMRSLSTGDIVDVDGKKFLCMSFGWNELGAMA